MQIKEWDNEMISEMEKVDFILKEGLKKGMVLSKFVKTQID